MTRSRYFQLLAVLLMSFLLVGCPPPPPKPPAPPPEHMAPKLAYIMQTQVRAETVTSNMIAFLEAKEYAGLSDSTGRALFQQAYERSVAALDEPDGQSKGALIGDGFLLVFQACVHYRLAECEQYDGEMPELSGAELMLEVFSAIELLAKKGEIICAEAAS